MPDSRAVLVRKVAKMKSLKISALILILAVYYLVATWNEETDKLVVEI